MKPVSLVDLLLENDLDPKAEIMRMDVHPFPKIRISFSRHRFVEGSEDPEEERGWEDEDGHEFELDEYDAEDGKTITSLAADWLKNEGVIEASSSRFEPGTWYTGPGAEDYIDGWDEEFGYHLVGFTEEQEAEIFYKVFAPKPWKRVDDPQGAQDYYIP